MAPPGKKLPWPIALLILALLALGVAWFASVELKAFHQARPPTGQAAMSQMRNTRPATKALASPKANAGALRPAIG